jgi:hypothetical protein
MLLMCKVHLFFFFLRARRFTRTSTSFQIRPTLHSTTTLPAPPVREQFGELRVGRRLVPMACGCLGKGHYFSRAHQRSERRMVSNYPIELGYGFDVWRTR